MMAIVVLLWLGSWIVSAILLSRASESKLVSVGGGFLVSVVFAVIGAELLAENEENPARQRAYDWSYKKSSNQYGVVFYN
ncbi:MAG: hypothetical protein U9Q81_25155 [Pseudomonadota bacterium]|nr:hypothetical protein [Pseudomonadota bacterium]